MCKQSTESERSESPYLHWTPYGIGFKVFSTLNILWGISSAGRAQGSQSWGQGFDPPMLHKKVFVFWQRLFYFVGGANRRKRKMRPLEAFFPPRRDISCLPTANEAVCREIDAMGQFLDEWPTDRSKIKKKTIARQLPMQMAKPLLRERSDPPMLHKKVFVFLTKTFLF